MDELAEGVLKAVFRFAGAVIRSLIWLIYELGFEVLGWYVGWPICRVLSFGKYPQQLVNDREGASVLTTVIVSTVGFAALILLAMLVAKLVGSG